MFGAFGAVDAEVEISRCYGCGEVDVCVGGVRGGVSVGVGVGVEVQHCDFFLPNRFVVACWARACFLLCFPFPFPFLTLHLIEHPV